MVVVPFVGESVGEDVELVESVALAVQQREGIELNFANIILLYQFIIIIYR